jgi:hypothetical protein
MKKLPEAALLTIRSKGQMEINLSLENQQACDTMVSGRQEDGKA